MFLPALDSTIVVTTLPTIVKDFGEPNKLAWIMTSYLLTATAFGPSYGRFADIFGRLPVFLFAIGTFLRKYCGCCCCCCFCCCFLNTKTHLSPSLSRSWIAPLWCCYQHGYVDHVPCFARRRSSRTYGINFYYYCRYV